MLNAYCCGVSNLIYLLLVRFRFGVPTIGIDRCDYKYLTLLG